MSFRWLRTPRPGANRGCCGVLLLGAVAWYALTGLAVWMLLQLDRGDEGDAAEIPWAVALLTPAVLLAVSPLLLWNYGVLYRRFTGDPTPKPSPPPPTVPPAGRERLTPDGPRYRLRRPAPGGLAVAGCMWGSAVGVVGLSGPFLVVLQLGQHRGWTGGWMSVLAVLSVLSWLAIVASVIAAVLLTVRGLVQFLGSRPRLGGRPAATLELSAHPLRPGQRCALSLTQPGDGAYDSLRVRLVCVEEVKPAGTRPPQTTRVRDLEVFRRDALVLQPDLPLTATIDLAVPADAMHSFHAVHHEISWQLVVDLRPEGGGSAEQPFSLIVYPPEAEGGSPVSAVAELVIELDRTDWLPGETLTGRLRLGPALAEAPGTVRVDVGWETVSDGQPDSGGVPAEERPDAPPGELRFAAVLPAAPLSYDGRLLSIRWRVTAQVSRRGGPAATATAPFRLGRLPPAGAATA